MAHIKIQERLRIETLLDAGHNATAIALQLGRNRATISKEIKRNSVGGKYCHALAQKQTDKRRANAKSGILTDDNCSIISISTRLISFGLFSYSRDKVNNVIIILDRVTMLVMLFK